MTTDRPFLEGDYKEDDGLIIHLTVTGRCYANCLGCVNTSVTLGRDEPRNSLEVFDETEPERDVKIIRELAGRHPGKKVTVCFYGGEPFLALDKMADVWRRLNDSRQSDCFRYLVYTNGEYLIEGMERFPEFMNGLWICSVSIDGREKQHDRVRMGTRLKRIVENLRALRGPYTGHLLYWSTLRENQSLLDCFEGFLELNAHRLADHFFWHWAEGREPFRDFTSFSRSYGRELGKVMETYVEELSKGHLFSIIHVNELVLYLLTGKERGHTACGVELAQNYDIASGRVFPCADLPEIHAIGDLDADGSLRLEESDLTHLVDYKSRLGCFDCGVHGYCGGRCPVQIKAGSWERALQHCELMRLHVECVRDRLDEIHQAIKSMGLSLQDIYDRSAFLTKYTDVVP